MIERFRSRCQWWREETSVYRRDRTSMAVKFVNNQMSARSILACWDNSTRGLDASSALEFVQALRLTTNLLQDAAVVAIYQAGERVYEGTVISREMCDR
jgi:ABC-type multidrug transport system ATPase subunit